MAIDPKLLRPVSTWETPGTLYACCLDPASGFLYGGGSEFNVFRVDPKAEKPAAEKVWTHHESYVSSMLWRDGVVVSGGFDRRIVWTKAESGEKLREVAAHEGWVRDLVLLPGSDRFASAGDDMLVKLWDAQTGAPVRTFEGHAKETPEGFATSLYALAVSGDGRHIAAADRVGEVCVWEVESGKLAARFRAPAFYTFDGVKRARSIGGIRSLEFLPEGNRLVLGGIGPVSNVDGFVGPCRVEVWNWSTVKSVFTGQDKHQAILNHLEWHPPTQTLIAAGGGDGGPIVAVWDLKTEAPLHKAKPKSHIQHFVFDSAGEQLFAAGFGGFQLWNFTPAPPAKS